MSFDQVLTLVATPPHPRIESKKIQQLMAILIASGAHVDVPNWLEPGVAVDLYLNGLTTAQAETLAEQVLCNVKVDAVAQKIEGRRKRMLLADMDSTIIVQESLNELADFAGLREEIAAITDQAMRGELDFAQAVRERVAKLRGLPVSAITQTLSKLTPTAGAALLLRTLKKHGASCHLVSGGFSVFTAAIAAELGFDSERGNRLVIENGVMTGEVFEPLLDRNSKLTRLHELCHEYSVNPEDVLTVGDGANDLPMLLASGLGIALHAKPKVNAESRARIKHSDLTALLYVQGYNREEWA